MRNFFITLIVGFLLLVAFATGIVVLGLLAIIIAGSVGMVLPLSNVVDLGITGFFLLILSYLVGFVFLHVIVDNKTFSEAFTEATRPFDQ